VVRAKPIRANTLFVLLTFCRECTKLPVRTVRHVVLTYDSETYC